MKSVVEKFVYFFVFQKTPYINLIQISSELQYVGSDDDEAVYGQLDSGFFFHFCEIAELPHDGYFGELLSIPRHGAIYLLEQLYAP